MYHARILTFSLVAACKAPAAFVVDEALDSDLQGDTHTDDKPACDGSLTLSFTDVPEGPLSTGTSWSSEGTVWRVSGYLTADVQVQRDDQGCVDLGAGTLTIDLLGTTCAAAAVRVTLTDRCGPACTVVRALAGAELVAETRNDTSNVEVSLSLAPSRAFGTVEVGSLDAAVCGVQVDRTDIPQDLRPEDTDAPF